MKHLYWLVRERQNVFACVWPDDAALWGPDRPSKRLPAGCWCRRSKTRLNMKDVCPETKSVATHLQIIEQTEGHTDNRCHYPWAFRKKHKHYKTLCVSKSCYISSHTKTHNDSLPLSSEFLQWWFIMQYFSTVTAWSVRTKSQVQISHLFPHPPSVCHHFVCSVMGVIHDTGWCILCMCVNNSTFAVVGEMEQKGLETARVWSELVPDDFTEQDDGNVVLNLKRTWALIRYITLVLHSILVLTGQW